MFNDLDSDIQTRIPDRPQRPFPSKISDMPEIPWLASHYVPQVDAKPTVKSVVATLVKTAIPILGTLAVLATIAIGGATLLSFYS
jgi:hypothetical protein